MTKLTKNLKFAGFSAIGVIMIIFVAAAISIAGWAVWQANNKSDDTKAASASSGQEAHTTSPKQPSKDAYAGWKTYTSDLGKFTLRYPADWSLAGFRGETGVGPGYTTGDVNGQETIIRLYHDEDAHNQFGLGFDLTNTAPADYGSYADGTVTELSNGLSMWTHKHQEQVVAGRAGICPVIQLVSDQSFRAQLSNGTVLTLDGSFCWNQKSDPTYSYDQQVSSTSFRQAKDILASIAPN